jgi:hypothetical protein
MNDTVKAIVTFKTAELDGWFLDFIPSVGDVIGVGGQCRHDGLTLKVTRRRFARVKHPEINPRRKICLVSVVECDD